MVKLTITYVYTEPLSQETGLVSGSQICEDDEKSLNNARENIYKTVKQKYFPQWIISKETATESIENTDFVDQSTGENAADQANDKNAAEGTDDVQTSTDPSVNTPSDASSGEVSVTTIEDVVNAFGSHAAWDPRLYRRDEFFEIEQSDATNGENATPVVIRAPFASNTAPPKREEEPPTTATITSLSFASASALAAMASIL